MLNIDIVKLDLITQIDKRLEDNIIERTNATLLKKLIRNAETVTEAMMIAELGTTYKRTGFHFDKRLEKIGDDIKYLKKNEELSFVNDKDKLTHKLIIGDNYDALQNLLITHRGKIDVIYIDPPYGKDDMGAFADTNYTNNITRDNLLSMLYPRLQIAKQLMCTHGVIFCSIDDKNQAYLKCLFDEVFGEQNFLGCIIQYKGNAQNDAKNIQKNHDYILVYINGRKYHNLNGKKKEITVLQDGKSFKKKVFIDEAGNFYYIGSGLVTGNASTLKERVTMGWSIYYNPITKDKIAIEDYNREIAKVSNNEDEVYTTRMDYINNGYIVIRPPKKNGKLGRWTWRCEEFNNRKDTILITDSLSVVQKVYVNPADITEIDGVKYYIKESLTENIKSICNFSSANGTSQLVEILSTNDFDNPKNVDLLKMLIKSYSNTDNPIILDFFAGSGTTGQAVLALNKEDGYDREFILCTNNEVTTNTPNGIAIDITSKRMKRIMSGECYGGSKDFMWLANNEVYGDNLEVFEIATVDSRAQSQHINPLTVIDETVYGIDKFKSVHEKINWLCNNFENTQKYIYKE